MSIIISIGKPIWKVMVERSGGSFRVAALFFSIIVINYDFDRYLGYLVKLKNKYGSGES